MNPLATTSILLHLTIRKWAGEVTDKKALAAVAKAFSGDTYNDKYKKSLFVTDPLSLIDRCAGRIRSHFYHDTMTWLDQGRLIPSKNFQAFAYKHKALKSEFYNEVECFISEYEDHCVKAKERKGDLYNAAEYPPVDQVRQKFEIVLTTLPFPSTKDFRVEAPEQVIQELKEEMETSIGAVNASVDKELQQRLVERLELLLNTLETGKRFNSSLITELAFIVHMAENLSTTLSEHTKKVLVVINEHILNYSSETIRDSQALQNKLIAVCKALI